MDWLSVSPCFNTVTYLKGLTLCIAPQPVLDGPPGLIEKIISDAYVFAVARTAIRLGQGVAL